MCHIVGEAYTLSRRRLLQGAGAAAMAAGAHSALGAPPASAQPPTRPRMVDEATARARTRLVLLGTSGGPVWWNSRRGIASAVVVGDARYLVDAGDGVGSQYQAAGLGESLVRFGASFGQGLAHLRALFLTHLHSDHTVDYNNLLLMGLVSGLAAPGRSPLQIYGPGNRGSLPPVFGPPPQAPLPVVNPDNPTPGLVEMTEYIVKANANDLNLRIRDERRPDVRTLFKAHDIALPAALTDDPNADPAPRMEPVRVFEDDRVKVTATLVLHRPVFPSFGFRFDTDDGSIVFSGDTAPSDNLIRLAAGADYLVHEVIDRRWVESLFPPPRTPFQEALILHLLGSHTLIEDVGKVAEAAGARTLVLNHLIPGDNPERRWKRARRGFSGRLVVGEDLLHLGLPRRRRSRRPSAGAESSAPGPRR